MLKRIFKNQWFVGITCSLIATALITFGTKTIDVPKINTILQYELKIRLWILILVIIIICLLIYFIPKLFEKKGAQNIELNFLNYKTDNFSGFQWVWKWKETEKDIYKISNLKMLCPKCHKGVFTMATMYSQKFDCVKCGHSLPTKFLNKPSYDQIKNEIVNEISSKFPTETNHIEHE